MHIKPWLSELGRVSGALTQLFPPVSEGFFCDGGTGSKGQVLGGNQQARISPGCCDRSGDSLFMSFCCWTSTLSTTMQTYIAKKWKLALILLSLLLIFVPGSLAVIVNVSWHHKEELSFPAESLLYKREPNQWWLTVLWLWPGLF